MYLLFLDGALVYIGASLDMAQRVKDHAKSADNRDVATAKPGTPGERNF